MTPSDPAATLSLTGTGALETLHVLASEPRLRILALLGERPMNVTELADALELPHSTVLYHVNLLQQVQLLHVRQVPGTRGAQKLASPAFEALRFQLPGQGLPSEPQVVKTSVAIGTYLSACVQPHCGLVGEGGPIGQVDDPRAFFGPERHLAQLLWFRSGFVEYALPNPLPSGATPTELELDVEVCSSAPHLTPRWPSDITVWINGVEVGTWTSPGDFYKGRRAEDAHGLLKRWRLTDEGAFLDGVRLSAVRLADLQLGAGASMAVRLGVKPDARHVGGMSLFGQSCGRYAQDLVLRTWYVQPGNPVCQGSG